MYVPVLLVSAAKAGGDASESKLLAERFALVGLQDLCVEGLYTCSGCALAKTFGSDEVDIVSVSQFVNLRTQGTYSLRRLVCK